jgi:hypothetical protein
MALGRFSDPDLGDQTRRFHQAKNPIHRDLLKASGKDPRHRASGKAGPPGQLGVCEIVIPGGTRHSLDQLGLHDSLDASLP